MNHPHIRRALVSLTGWILLCALLLIGLSSLRWDLEAERLVTSQVPRLITESLINAHDPRAALEQNLRRLNSHPLQLKFPESHRLVSQAEIHWLALGIEPTPESGQAHTLRWQQDGRWLSGQWQLVLKWDPLHLVAFSCGLGGLLWLLSLGIPDPRQLHQRHWLRHLQELGIGQSASSHLLHQLKEQPTLLGEAEALARETGRPLTEVLSLLEQETIRQLAPTERDWLSLALRQGLDHEAALVVASHPPTLHFDLPASQVLIHGMAVRLSRTPLLYYYWYARRHLEGLAPYINPSSQKPDLREGEVLAELMRQHGGHGKAMSDLLAHGLKSKTLDQNRNKIRDELRQILGELAEPYLFISERDPTTARYRHTLAIPREHVVLQ